MAMPLHRGLMTIEEYDALPDDALARYELQEGVLVVSPRPARKHSRATGRLYSQITAQLPLGFECLIDFEIVVQAEFPATLRAPDLLVLPADGAEQRISAAEALIAVEIISPGSRNVDLHLKPFEYADAGVPHYWVVDLDPPVPTITVFGLGAPAGGYRESQTATGELVVSQPFPLRVDIEALVNPEY